MASAITPFTPSKLEDLGELRKFATEIRWHIYKFALPPRILRFYRDHEKKHIFVEALAAPDLAFVCHDTWNFCLFEYSRVPFTPIHDGRVQQITEPQAFDTWFCPWLDILYFDTNESRRYPKLTKLAASAYTAADDDDNSVERFNYTGHWADTLAPLMPFTKKATSVVVGNVCDTFFYFCMNTELFPSLEHVYLSPGTYQLRGDTTWAQEVATYTQENRAIITPGQPPRRSLKIRPLYPSRTRYNTLLKKHVPLGDHYLQQKWDKVPDTFPTVGFAHDFRDQDYKVLAERMAAVLRLYWDTAYVMNEYGDREYAGF
ncbi:hypothetical protein PG984_009060 [Apiospora sp. TS-2023a]